LAENINLHEKSHAYNKHHAQDGQNFHEEQAALDEPPF
jgi:hypothetical protein